MASLSKGKTLEPSGLNRRDEISSINFYVSASVLVSFFSIFVIIAFLVQETEISQWEVPQFFSKSTFHMNKAFNRDKSFQSPYDNNKYFPS